jgi:hypothetical protein
MKHFALLLFVTGLTPVFIWSSDKPRSDIFEAYAARIIRERGQFCSYRGCMNYESRCDLHQEYNNRAIDLFPQKKAKRIYDTDDTDGWWGYCKPELQPYWRPHQWTPTSSLRKKLDKNAKDLSEK